MGRSAWVIQPQKHSSDSDTLTSEEKKHNNTQTHAEREHPLATISAAAKPHEKHAALDLRQ